MRAAKVSDCRFFTRPTPYDHDRKKPDSESPARTASQDTAALPAHQLSSGNRNAGMAQASPCRPRAPELYADSLRSRFTIQPTSAPASRHPLATSGGSGLGPLFVSPLSGEEAETGQHPPATARERQGHLFVAWSLSSTLRSNTYSCIRGTAANPPSPVEWNRAISQTPCAVNFRTTPHRGLGGRTDLRNSATSRVAPGCTATISVRPSGAKVGEPPRPRGDRAAHFLGGLDIPELN